MVGEIKKDEASIDNIDQLLKYVDWVKDEYCFGDYGMIRSFLIAYDFPDEVIEYANDIATRKYIIGRRPAQSLEWNNLTLVKYKYDVQRKLLKFEQLQQ